MDTQVCSWYTQETQGGLQTQLKCTRAPPAHPLFTQCVDCTGTSMHSLVPRLKIRICATIQWAALLYQRMASAASRLHVYSMLEHFTQALQGICIWELSNMTDTPVVSKITNSSARIQVLITYLFLCYFYHTFTIPRTYPGSRLCKAKSKVTLRELCGLGHIKGTTTAVTMHRKIIRQACPSGNNLVSEKYLYYKKAPFTAHFKHAKGWDDLAQIR